MNQTTGFTTRSLQCPGLVCCCTSSRLPSARHIHCGCRLIAGSSHVTRSHGSILRAAAPEGSAASGRDAGSPWGVLLSRKSQPLHDIAPRAAAPADDGDEYALPSGSSIEPAPLTVA